MGLIVSDVVRMGTSARRAGVPDSPGGHCPPYRMHLGGYNRRMDINLLVLNVGNSRLAVGVFLAGELAHSIRIAHENRADWAGKIADAWKRIEGEENAAVAGARVNPLLNEELEHSVEQVTKRPLNWVGKQIDLPIKVLTEKPAETGVDRIVNIAAA